MGDHCLDAYIVGAHVENQTPAVGCSPDADPLRIHFRLVRDLCNGVTTILHQFKWEILTARLTLAVTKVSIVKNQRRKARVNKSSGEIRKDLLLHACKSISHDDHRRLRTRLKVIWHVESATTTQTFTSKGDVFTHSQIHHMITNCQ